VKAQWFKSSKSGTNGGSCVEVRMLDGKVQIRDSKDRTGPILTFTPAEWDAFLDGARKDEFEI
jgi:hypothetical protein